MGVRAVYMLRADAVGRAISVRVRQRPVQAEMPNGALPTLAEVDLAILFDRAEVSLPARNAFVVLSDAEAYQVRTIEPSYLDSVTASVVRLSESQAHALWLAGKPSNF